MILTDVEHAILNFGKENAQPVGTRQRRGDEEARRRGSFPGRQHGPEGRLGHQVRRVAAAQRAIITSLDKAVDALAGKMRDHHHEVRA